MAAAAIFVSCKGKARRPLKTLSLKTVADFTTRQDLGVVVDATVGKGGKVFFFEAGREKLFRLSLSSPAEPVQIGEKGEGPGEYAGLSSVYADEERVYALDSRSKILVYSYGGELLFEQKFKTELYWPRFVGKLGQRLFFYSIHFKDRVNPTMGLFCWREGKEPEKLMDLPVVAEIKKRGSGEKVMFQIFFLSFPTYALVNGNLLYSASPSYSLHLRSLEGKELWRASLKAPPAEIPPYLRKFLKKSRKKLYPIITAFQCRNRICVLCNYYEGNKPRLDVFSLEGKFLRSYLFPLKIERPVANPIKVQGEYLLYFPSGEEGFKVYRLPGEI